MSENQPFIILVQPQLAVNIGMSARAMMNCGLYHMRLVAPKENHLSDIAIAAASGAEKILYNAQMFSSTAEAVADLEKVFATTARRRDMIKTINTAEAAAKKITDDLVNQTRYGILFGPERTGLHNDDVVLSDEIIEIPLNPEHCSLNLAQAVLVIGYEYYKTTIAPEGRRFITNGGQVADKEKLFKFVENLNGRIKQSPRLKDEEHTKSLLRNISNIFTRAQITEQELNSLYGIVNILSDGK